MFNFVLILISCTYVCWLNPGSKLKWLMWTNALWQAKDNKSLKMVNCPPPPLQFLNDSVISGSPEAEFLDVIGTKVLRVFLLAIHSHLYFLDVIGTKVLRVFLLDIQSHLYYRFYSYTPPPPFETSLLYKHCIVYRNLKSENSQDYARKPQRNCTFVSSASCERQLKK